MYLYHWGSHIIEEEEIDKIIAKKKEDARKLYLEHGSPLLNEYGEECPDARYLSTCGVGICVLDTEEEFDKNMAIWKKSLGVDYSPEAIRGREIKRKILEYNSKFRGDRINPEDFSGRVKIDFHPDNSRQYIGGTYRKTEEETC